MGVSPKSSFRKVGEVGGIWKVYERESSRTDCRHVDRFEEEGEM